MEAAVTTVPWMNIKTGFLEKYFPTNVRSRKEIDFFQLKKYSMIVVDYVAKFKYFIKKFPYYIDVEDEGPMCVQIESGLHYKIK